VDNSEKDKTVVVLAIAARADALYSARSTIQAVRESVETLRSCQTPNDYEPDDYEIDWRLGRALFFLGQEAACDSEGREHFTEGASVCKRAIRASPERVEGHFWCGVNLALRAQLERPWAAFWLAFSAKSELTAAVRIDAAYHAAGPLRVLGRLQHHLPVYLGGGLKRAAALYREAIRLAPSNTVTRLYFAELLAHAGDKEGARKELLFLLHLPNDPEWEFELERDRQRAREILKRL
jgi:tetratricopeptide (TPR) repeat protein